MAVAIVALPAAAATGQTGREEAKMATPADEPVANLPYARGRSFTTLDEYLAHLKSLGAIDLPWWREIRPGVYERVTSIRGAPREVATREELMRRFGFSR